MSSQEEPRYVRFGGLPTGKRRSSKNPLAGESLAGVCCYSGRLVKPDLFRIDTAELNDERGMHALVGIAAIDRPAYFVEGEEVGTGPDGEPLVIVEHIWPVPASTSITSVETFAQPALRLWSEGPRDGTGQKLLRWRLGREDSPYLDGTNLKFVGLKSPHAAAASKKHQPGELQEKRKRQKQARKKQRAKKR